MDLPEKSRRDLGWDGLLAELARLCETERGARAALALAPERELAVAEAHAEEVSEARTLDEADARLPFGGITDVSELCDRASKEGTLEAEELVAVASTVRSAARMREFLVDRSETCARLAARAGAIADLDHVWRPLGEAFDAHGELRDDASAALGGLRRRLSGIKDELGRRLRGMLDDPEFGAVLQDRFHTEREGRYVLPIRADARMRIGGIVHGASGSGATFYVEPPALVEQNNRLTVARMEVQREERRILTELSGLVGEFAAPIKENLSVLETLDLRSAAARLSRKTGGTIARLLEREPPGAPVRETRLPQLRHPLLVLSKGLSEVVANDLQLEAGRTLVISGPNAGGKTVAMKSLGLALLMARSGLHVTADGQAQVVPFDALYTDVGDDQSLERDLSTFSAHIGHVVDFLGRAGPHALVLLDEVAVGTDPEQGAALAQAMLEAFAERGATLVATTHYDRLKALGAEDPRFANASVGFALAELAPTYKLHLGIPGPSYALEIARRLGLPATIVERAQRLSQGGRKELERLLVQVAEEQQRLELARAQANRAQAEAESARRDAEMRARSLRDRERELVRGASTEAVAALRQARLELDELAKVSRRRTQRFVAGDAGAAGTLDEERQKLARAEATISQHGERPPESDGRPARPEELVPGLSVQVPRLGGAVVVETAPERGKLTVRMGALRSQVKVDEVFIGTAPSLATPPSKRRETRKAVAAHRDAKAEGTPQGLGTTLETTPVRTARNTCDLRGMRVDEALTAAERFADDALQAGEPAVFFLHGHGTGALRGAIREWCDQSGLFAVCRAGEPSEGGDGITVSVLR